MQLWKWKNLPQTKGNWSNELRECVSHYRDSLDRRNEVYGLVQKDFPGGIQCSPLCNECCSQTFFVRWLDLFVVRLGFVELSSREQERVVAAAMSWVEKLPPDIPQLVVGTSQEVVKLAEIEELLPHRHMPCPLVLPLQGCQIYPWRPVICRSFGYPSLQLDGRMMSTCEKNLQGVPSDQLSGYSLPYQRYLEVARCKEELSRLMGVPEWNGFVASLGLVLAIFHDPVHLDWAAIIQDSS